MKYLVAVVLCVFLVGFGAQRKVIAAKAGERTTVKSAQKKETRKKTGTKKKKSTPKTAKQNAAALVGQMEKAIAHITKYSRQGGGTKAGKLDPKKKAQRPYWVALKAINADVDRMKKALAAKDRSFFGLVSASGGHVTQLSAGAQVVRISDPQVLRGIKALAVAHNQLYKNFGKEALRARQGGKLTQQEVEQFNRMQTQVTTAQTRLQTMRDKVKNPRLRSRLNNAMKAASRARRLKADSASAYASMLQLANYLYYDWQAVGAYAQYWAPEYYTEWQTSSSYFESYYESYSSTYESIEVTEWSSVETSIEVVDTYKTYDLEVTQQDLEQTDSFVESYTETEATEELSTDEMSAAEADTSSSEDVAYDAQDDEDGDGLEDADDPDDDGDGTPDEKDADDDNDGVADNDTDGDGTPNDKDTDDDNDGTLDAEDDDDSGDGIPDDEDDDTDNDGLSDDQDADADNDGSPDTSDADDDNDGVDDADDTDDGGSGEDGGDDGGDEG